MDSLADSATQAVPADLVPQRPALRKDFAEGVKHHRPALHRKGLSEFPGAGAMLKHITTRLPAVSNNTAPANFRIIAGF
jgi:hypothetical protein